LSSSPSYSGVFRRKLFLRERQQTFAKVSASNK
jgi:hypothetical protein